MMLPSNRPWRERGQDVFVPSPTALALLASSCDIPSKGRNNPDALLHSAQYHKPDHRSINRSGHEVVLPKYQ